MKKFLIVLLVGIFLLGLGNSPCGAQAAKKLKMGLIGAFSGPLAPMGLTTRNGALLAQKHINEDGGFVVAGQRYLVDLSCAMTALTQKWRSLARLGQWMKTTLKS